VQSLARRLASGGALTCPGVCPPAQPFVAALLREIFPTRSIVIVAENLKAQESVQQDLETWLGLESNVPGLNSKAGEAPCSTLHHRSSPLFYPAWEILPHEGKLPHADVISDRLETLVALADESGVQNQKSKVVVVSVAALLQKTFAPQDLKSRMRRLGRGDRTDPLDLVEWLESQGYEPEAQVTQRGEIAMRGGIVDIFPPTSPWPVRLEFFGDELESLREFDPLTQVSREQIAQITLPPAGELGILMRAAERPEANAPLATLLDYLPAETIFLLCEPEQLAIRAAEYAQQIPSGDAFFLTWEKFTAEIDARGITRVELSDAETDDGVSLFATLEAFRPLPERAPEAPVAEAQRREFFNQLHR
jgi:hypothetical protein